MNEAITPDTDMALARLIWLVSIAEIACQGRVVGDIRPEPVLPTGFRLIGLITGDDHGLITAQEIYFGFVASDGVRTYVVIRGTEHFLEWVEDAEVGLVAHPYGGRVEVGFWSVYGSLRYEGLPLISGLAAALGSVPVTVIGHSLGGPLAIHLAFDLVKATSLKVACRAFACPKPGDTAFAAAFATAVLDHLVINYSRDVVPHLPLNEDFVQLPLVKTIYPTLNIAEIKFSLACNHHATSYAALLDYTIADWSEVGATCVLGLRGT